MVRLQAYFDKVDAENEARRREAEAKRLEEEREKAYEAKRNAAAIMLQALFRGFRARTDLKKKGKGKKGKKKAAKQ